MAADNSDDREVEVRLLGPEDAERLAALFDEIGADEEGLARFHPHPFDRATALDICQHAEERPDRYFGAFADTRMVGYGMLRGWDEGYEIPSFGVYVAKQRRGHGLGGLLLDYAIRLAGEAGAPEVMLKVYAGNATARQLYEGRGFVFGERTPDGRQLVGRLRLGS